MLNWRLGTVLVALATLAVYWPALDGAFLWDDVDIYIVENPLLSQADGLRKFWFSTSPLDYYPLTYTTFWCEYRLWGLAPRGYHVVNLALHLLNGLVVWRLFAALRVPTAGWIAAVFMLHPVCVESVAWISQRKTLLAALFANAAFLVLASRRASRCAPILFALSLAAKPTAVLAPFAFLALFRAQGNSVAKSLRRSIAYFALSVAFGGVGWWFQSHRAIGATEVRRDTTVARLQIAGRAVAYYATTAVIPVGLAFVPERWELDHARIRDWAWFAGTCAAAAFAARRRFSRNAASLYTLALLPALGFVDVYFFRYAYAADHYQYLALPAILALAASLAQRWVWPLTSSRVRAVAATAVLALFGWISHAQAEWYRDEASLWKATLARNPHAWIAHGNLVRIEFAAGRPDEARRHHAELRRSLAEPLARLRARAITALRQNRAEEALDILDRIRELDPIDPWAHGQLGLMATAARQWQRALEHIRMVRESDEMSVSIAIAEARSWAALGQSGRAAQLLQEAQQRFGRSEELSEAIRKTKSESP